MNEVVRKVFAYDGNNVTFASKNGIAMVNATQMASKFGKKPAKWLELPSTSAFLTSLAEVRKSDIESDRKSHTSELQSR